MNATEYAQYRGVNTTLVSAWIKRGYLDGAYTRGQNGRYQIDRDAADRMLDENLDHRYTRENRSQVADIPNMTFQQARTEKERHLAGLRRLEYEEKAGQLIPAADVQTLLEALISAARVKLMGLKAQVAPILAESVTDPATRDRILQTVEQLTNQILTDLSNDQFDSNTDL